MTSTETLDHDVEQTEGAPAPTVERDTKFPPEDVARELGDRLLAARESGWSREATHELAGSDDFTPAKIWRIEAPQYRVHAAEVDAVRELLERLESETPPARRVGRVTSSRTRVDIKVLEGAVSRLKEVLEATRVVLADIDGRGNASRAQLAEAVKTALAELATVEPETPDEDDENAEGGTENAETDEDEATE